MVYALARELRRELNELIYELLTREEPAARMRAFCECCDPCVELVEIDLGVYERVRSHRGWLLLLPGHERLGELVVETDEYKIVQFDEAANAARAAGRPGSRRGRPTHQRPAHHTPA
jgi:hypothetical protein